MATRHEIYARVFLIATALLLCGFVAYYLAIAWTFDSPCADVGTPDATRHYRDHQAEFDSLSAMLFEKAGDALVILEDDSWGCTPRWNDFSITLKCRTGTRTVTALNGEDRCETSPDVVEGLRQLGLAANDVPRFFALVRAVGCVGVSYGSTHPVDSRDRRRGLDRHPIHYTFRREGLGAYTFIRYAHLPTAIEENALSQQGFRKLDEHTLLEYSSGL